MNWLQKTGWLAIVAGAWIASGIGGAAPVESSALASNASTLGSLTVTLAQQEAPSPVMNVNVAVLDQSGPFAKEPPREKERIRRGRLSLPGTATPELSFLWDCTRGRLYLDLNRNSDLTDDPGGVFSSAFGPNVVSTFVSGQFTNVPLPFGTGERQLRHLVDLHLTDYRGGVSAYAGLRSFWAGQVTLAGQEWQIGVIDHPTASAYSVEPAHLLLRPWSRRNDPFSLYDGSIDVFPLPKQLFVASHLYEMDRTESRRDGESRRQLVLKEQPTELGEVLFSGRFVQRALLIDGPCVAVLEPPASTVRVPIGQYRDCKVQLTNAGMVVRPERPDPSQRTPLLVQKDKPVTLAAGGPLTNSVTIRSRGRVLVFNYRLLGAGGESYQPISQDPLQPPQFIVYQSGQKIASGRFEFG